MSDRESVLVVIPARLGSTRLPEKCLLPLCGKPMIVWVAEAASRSRRADRVVVATDHERIVDTVKAAGFEAVMTRKDHPSGTDRVAEAAAGSHADVIINVQGDEPLMDPQLVDRLADTMQHASGWDMATAASPMTNPGDLDQPSVVKVVCDKDGRALYFSRAPIPFPRDGEPAPPRLYWRHLGVYAYRRAFLERLVATPPCPIEQAEKLEQLRALYIGGRIAVLETEDRGAGVDTPADIARVEHLLQTRDVANRDGIEAQVSV